MVVCCTGLVVPLRASRRVVSTRARGEPLPVPLRDDGAACAACDVSVAASTRAVVSVAAFDAGLVSLDACGAPLWDDTAACATRDVSVDAPARTVEFDTGPVSLDACGAPLRDDDCVVVCLVVSAPLPVDDVGVAAAPGLPVCVGAPAARVPAAGPVSLDGRMAPSFEDDDGDVVAPLSATV